MKTKFYGRTIAFAGKGLFNAATTVLFLFTLMGTVWGQSSYTDVYVSGDSVVAYGAMIGGYGMGSHIDTTSLTLSGPPGYASSIGGSSATTYLAIGDGGVFTAYTSHDSYCPDANANFPGVASSGGQTTVPATECSVCQGERTNKRIACIGVATTCELGFLALYNSNITSCENNPFCQENNPNYNPAECDRCKDDYWNTFLIQSAGCAAALPICLATTLPDCQLKQPLPCANN